VLHVFPVEREKDDRADESAEEPDRVPDQS
jgi:hypothetical protein